MHNFYLFIGDKYKPRFPPFSYPTSKPKRFYSIGKTRERLSARITAAMEAAGIKGGKVIVGKQYCDNEERELTVRKTSVFFSGDGFAAYDHHTGVLVFRVDTYARGPGVVIDELVLMDPVGTSIITLRRKRPSLHNRWEGFLGERAEGQKPLFTVRRSSIFGGDRAGVTVEVHGGSGAGEGVTDYRVEGSFAARCCRVIYAGEGEGEEEGEVVAEIKRKVDPCAHVILGRDVFCLSLRPRVDAAFVMGLVIVLDRICGDEDVGAGVDPAAVAAVEVGCRGGGWGL
ncbi:protein LURP-one-related 5 [Phalaenopsis equestris]|uniref:protein LURP-one-related 5 n=1 Tax=Phalaenopsis equestris TaxID=78828 RepID=UPI0009E2B2B7|nr:protein LURP-one-related 5 [Phalaenopsis equestris]